MAPFADWLADQLDLTPVARQSLHSGAFTLNSTEEIVSVKEEVGVWEDFMTALIEQVQPFYEGDDVALQFLSEAVRDASTAYVRMHANSTSSTTPMAPHAYRV